MGKPPNFSDLFLIFRLLAGITTHVEREVMQRSQRARKPMSPLKKINNNIKGMAVAMMKCP